MMNIEINVKTLFLHKYIVKNVNLVVQIRAVRARLSSERNKKLC